MITYWVDSEPLVGKSQDPTAMDINNAYKLSMNYWR